MATELSALISLGELRTSLGGLLSSSRTCREGRVRSPACRVVKERFPSRHGSISEPFSPPFFCLSFLPCGTSQSIVLIRKGPEGGGQEEQHRECGEVLRASVLRPEPQVEIVRPWPASTLDLH